SWCFLQYWLKCRLNGRLLGAPIHLVGSHAGHRGCCGEFEFIPGQADGSFRIRPFNIWDKGSFVSPAESLVRLVDRPGPKIAGERPRRLAIFRCWSDQTGIGAGLEFGTVGAPVYLSVSPTGIEDQDASRIVTEILPLGTGRGRGLVRDERPASDELVLER